MDLTHLADLSSSINVSNLTVCSEDLLVRFAADSTMNTRPHLAYQLSKIDGLLDLFGDDPIFVHVGGAAHVDEAPHEAAQVIGLVK